MNTKHSNTVISNSTMNPEGMTLAWLEIHGTEEQRAWVNAQVEEIEAQQALEAEAFQLERMAEEQRRDAYAAELTALGANRFVVRAIMGGVSSWRTQAAGEALAEYRAQQRAYYRDQLLERGVPVDCLKSVFDKVPDDRDALVATRAWLGTDELFLVLSSQVGRGKSGAASWACAEANGRYVTAEELRAAFFDDKKWRQLQQEPFLAIDDLGTEHADGKGFSITRVSDFLCQRYAQNLRTVITNNVTAKQFKETYGERVIDRIRHRGTWHDVGGPSLR